jgi:hypothetical protein
MFEGQLGLEVWEEPVPGQKSDATWNILENTTEVP